MIATHLLILKLQVRYCNEHNLRFLPQSGGHGWADTFDLGESGVLIDLRGLNSIVFNEARDQATIGGGTINGEWVEASLAHGRQAREFPSFFVLFVVFAVSNLQHSERRL